MISKKHFLLLLGACNLVASLSLVRLPRFDGQRQIRPRHVGRKTAVWERDKANPGMNTYYLYLNESGNLLTTTNITELPLLKLAKGADLNILETTQGYQTLLYVTNLSIDGTLNLTGAAGGPTFGIDNKGSGDLVINAGAHDTGVSTLILPAKGKIQDLITPHAQTIQNVAVSLEKDPGIKFINNNYKDPGEITIVPNNQPLVVGPVHVDTSGSGSGLDPQAPVTIKINTDRPALIGGGTKLTIIDLQNTKYPERIGNGNLSIMRTRADTRDGRAVTDLEDMDRLDMTFAVNNGRRGFIRCTSTPDMKTLLVAYDFAMRPSIPQNNEMEGNNYKDSKRDLSLKRITDFSEALGIALESPGLGSKAYKSIELVPASKVCSEPDLAGKRVYRVTFENGRVVTVGDDGAEVACTAPS